MGCFLVTYRGKVYTSMIYSFLEKREPVTAHALVLCLSPSSEATETSPLRILLLVPAPLGGLHPGSLHRPLASGCASPGAEVSPEQGMENEDGWILSWGWLDSVGILPGGTESDLTSTFHFLSCSSCWGVSWAHD